MKLTNFLFFLLLIVNEIALSEEEIWNYSNGNYQGHKFSTLDKINPANVNRLKKHGLITLALFLLLKTTVK